MRADVERGVWGRARGSIEGVGVSVKKRIKMWGKVNGDVGRGVGFGEVRGEVLRMWEEM